MKQLVSREDVEMACVRTSGLEGAGELGTRQIEVEIMPNQCPAKDFWLILLPWYNMWTAANVHKQFP